MRFTKIARASVLLCLVLVLSLAWGQDAHHLLITQPQITDVWTDKARYAPGEKIRLTVQIDDSVALKGGSIVIALEDCGHVVEFRKYSLNLTPGQKQSVSYEFNAPRTDYHGYRIGVRVLDRAEHEIANGSGALDVSSDWTRFPRYGYVANYQDGIPAEPWIEQLNRYHINGVLFYDVQYKHHQPAPSGDALPAHWPDVAGRSINRDTVRAFLSAAKSRNMMNMAYCTGYAAYADAFTDGSGVKLEWAAWPDAKVVRTPETVKQFPLPPGWATPRLLYMNQENPQWRKYLFGRMTESFKKLPFDGWHIDTYGEPGAWAFDGTPIDYIAGLPNLANEARSTLGKPVVLNTVSGLGEAAMANSAVEFVYSELWPEDHATYGSILRAADEIREVNRKKPIVFAAYLHRALAEKLAEQGGSTKFNVASVLLADAVIFSAGASHIELGDGDRMLSRPYFVDDTTISMTPLLRARLRDYYDFQVAYENHLRDGASSAKIPVSLAGVKQTETGEAGAVWTIVRHRNDETVVHLINLVGKKSDLWRDDAADYPEPPLLRDIHVKVKLDSDVKSAGWASPDVEHGKWHELQLQTNGSGEGEFVIPELHYWTTIIFRQTASKR